MRQCACAGHAQAQESDEATACAVSTLPFDDVHAAPLLRAGLIGWRCLRRAGDAARVLPLHMGCRQATTG